MRYYNKSKRQWQVTQFSFNETPTLHPHKERHDFQHLVAQELGVLPGNFSLCPSYHIHSPLQRGTVAVSRKKAKIFNSKIALHAFFVSSCGQYQPGPIFRRQFVKASESITPTIGLFLNVGTYNLKNWYNR